MTIPRDMNDTSLITYDFVKTYDEFIAEQFKEKLWEESSFNALVPVEVVKSPLLSSYRQLCSPTPATPPCSTSPSDTLAELLLSALPNTEAVNLLEIETSERVEVLFR